MTYDELVQAVQDYTVNTETSFVANIPTFIRQAEEQIVRSLPMTNFRASKTANVTAGNQYLGTPSDFLASYGLSVEDDAGVTSSLLPKDVTLLREAYPDPTDTALPKYYAMFDDDTIILAPTPDLAYQVELHYYYTPAGLSSSNSTTWISLNAQNALLYGTLYHAYVFMKGDEDLIKYYGDLFKAGIGDMSKIGGERQKTDQFKESEVAL